MPGFEPVEEMELRKAVEGALEEWESVKRRTPGSEKLPERYALPMPSSGGVLPSLEIIHTNPKKRGRGEDADMRAPSSPCLGYGRALHVKPKDRDGLWSRVVWWKGTTGSEQVEFPVYGR